MTKLNIAKRDVINGYINIDTVANEQHPEVQVGDIENLDWIVDNGELDELLADKILEHISYNKIPEVLSNWVSKLRVGGELIIGCLDILELARLLHMDILDVPKFNNIVHGAQNTQTQYHKSSISTQQLIEFIKPHSLKLMKHNLSGVDATLVFERII